VVVASPIKPIIAKNATARERLQRDLVAIPGTLPEIALRFCISHPAVSTVIPGMRTVRHVEANIAVSDAGPLEPGTLEVLRRHTWDKNFYGE